jgi:hypothetical protein
MKQQGSSQYAETPELRLLQMSSLWSPDTAGITVTWYSVNTVSPCCFPCNAPSYTLTLTSYVLSNIPVFFVNDTGGSYGEFLGFVYGM